MSRAGRVARWSAAALLLIVVAADGNAAVSEERCRRGTIGLVAARMADGLRCEALPDLARAIGCRERVAARFRKGLARLGQDCVSAAESEAMERDASLLVSQMGASVKGRAGALLTAAGHWDTELVMDLGVTGQGYDATPPDVAACRAAGQCPGNILIIQCRTELGEVGGEPAYVTPCRSAPESGFQMEPYMATPDLGTLQPSGENEWVVDGEAGTGFGAFDFQVRYRLGPGWNSLTGVGIIDGGRLWTFFLTGTRVP